ncbi:hypothetical protein PACID_14370 [Acidipropionibacterium acidipropionici ATCC 4875]|uniref:Uncharacterized protein n=1 Tax=Acidipropionibacterium acidipropionici (strain ATCC 4875 / DSM 20272 / JCM 6432 / NBRC 12425 / NCIMB 8070 / 4) TaxID=1171373 RepID=K7RMT0_ACIA4|nr:hypothetical protein PACID_14370 [Acidipropionibacterium acidipropionici ATCC 4875]
MRHVEQSNTASPSRGGFDSSDRIVRPRSRRAAGRGGRSAGPMAGSTPCPCC